MVMLAGVLLQPIGAQEAEEKKVQWKLQDDGGAILGFDPTGNSGTDVGDEVDLTYRFDWREKAKVEVGLSRFWPGQFAENTRGGDPSDWGYVQLTWGF
jgi:Alginate export